MSFLFIPIICGARSFESPYDNNPQHSALYCPHCHNFSVAPIKKKQFFTVWFVPLVPLYWGKQLRCSICNWRQDFKTPEDLERIVAAQQNIKSGGVYYA